MTRRARLYFAPWLAFVAVFWGNTGSAGAQPSLQVALEYSADPALDCPGAAELSASIVAQLGYDPFTPAPAGPRLRVAVSKLGDGAEAHIEWIDQNQQSEGERRLASGSGGCAELARSLPFALAVQIQLHASTPPARPAPSVAAPAPAPPPKQAPPRAATAKPRRLILAGAGVLARHGVAPGISAGLRVFGALVHERWSLELSGHATLPTELQQADGTGFRAHELAANLVPCARFGLVGLCAVGTLSVLHVRGQGVDRIGSPASTAGGVGGRLQLLWPALERLGVVVQGEALVRLAPREVLLNQQPVWSSAPVAFTAILDFAAIFQ
jgi:hypothetical protein